MAPVIWGLDLAEIQWSKFKSSYMWNSDYHLRRTKFIVYQCALIFCVVSESLGTAALSDYIDQQRLVQTLDSRAYVFNNDYVGAASYNIFGGVFVAFIFGAAFFFDLIWPERAESRSVRIAWKVCGIMATIFHLAAALTLTVITAKHSGYVTGVSSQRARYLLSQFTKDGGSPLIYRHNGRAVAAVVFVWLGWISVVPSCVLLFMSIDHTETGPGPLSKHARMSREAQKVDKLDSEAQYVAQEKPMEQPAPATNSDVASAQTDGTPYPSSAAEDPPAHPKFAAANAGDESAAHTAAQHAAGVS